VTRGYRFLNYVIPSIIYNLKGKALGTRLYHIYIYYIQKHKAGIFKFLSFKERFRDGLACHVCELRRAKRSVGKESGEEAIKNDFLYSRLLPLDVRLVTTTHGLVLQAEPACRLVTDQCGQQICDKKHLLGSKSKET